MRKRAFQLLCVLACAAVHVPVAVGQEGHPLTGTWVGDWGPNGTDRTRITLVIEWDGKAATGTLNPGPNAVPLPDIALDVTDWTVRFAADGTDRSGTPARIEVEGRIEDIGSWHRRLAGTWTEGAMKGDFRVTRQ